MKKGGVMSTAQDENASNSRFGPLGIDCIGRIGPILHPAPILDTFLL